MEALCPSETSIEFQWTTPRYIPKASALHNHHRENLKSYRDFFVFPYNSWLHYSFHVFLINMGQTPFRYAFREHRYVLVKQWEAS
jgi:hypothetical protein